jgi:hypothetical protein
MKSVDRQALTVRSRLTCLIDWKRGVCSSTAIRFLACPIRDGRRYLSNTDHRRQPVIGR